VRFLWLFLPVAFLGALADFFGGVLALHMGNEVGDIGKLHGHGDHNVNLDHVLDTLEATRGCGLHSSLRRRLRLHAWVRFHLSSGSSRLLGGRKG
jgi:hypothetical protein